MSKHVIPVAKAKGRPMLTWVGKKPLARVTAFPAQHIETVPAPETPVPLAAIDWSDWPRDLPQGGLLYHGDNKEVLAHLLANGFRGKVKLIYIDPPFDSGADYVRKVQLRGPKGGTKVEGEDYTLGEQVQYSDIWANDNYLQFMYERLLLLRELLAADGSIVIHANSKKGFLLRCLLDEVFSPDGYRNEITWHYVKYQMGDIKQFVDNTDRLIWYSKGETWTYTRQTEKLETPKFLLAKGWDKEKGLIVNLRNAEGKTYKVHLIELRSDRKSGGFIKHEPLSAQVDIHRDGGKLIIEITDVVSPSILQRLNKEAGVFRAEISDWRAMVDCVLIDTDHDGKVFKIALADVPERKQDVVSGHYELPAPKISGAGATVAIKIIDMLGEECLVSVPCP